MRLMPCSVIPAAAGPGSREIEKDDVIETRLNKGSQISRTISRWCLASRRVGLRRPLRCERSRVMEGTPVAAPPPPPPVRAEEDLESIVELTPEQALHGTTVELNLEDGTIVELDTPPQAGDGWRLRLEGVASGGRDHFLQLRVLTDDGLRIDGLRVHYKLLLFPRMRPSAAQWMCQPLMAR